MVILGTLRVVSAKLALPEGVVLRRVEIGQDRFSVGRPFCDEVGRRTEKSVDADVLRKLLNSRCQ